LRHAEQLGGALESEIFTLARAPRMATLQMLAIARYRCALRLALHAARASFAPGSSVSVH